MNGKRGTLLTILTLTLLFLASLPSERVQADSGGWGPTTTTTPTAITANATVTPGGANTSSIDLPTPKPGGSSAIVNADTVLVLTPQATAYPAPRDGAGGLVACWPIALVTFIAGVAGLNAVRTALRRGQ